MKGEQDTPLMIEVGDSDHSLLTLGRWAIQSRPSVKRDVILLVYAGEDHGLRKKPNQLDYHRRIIEWFGHYLKDELASPWVTGGVIFLERKQELTTQDAKGKELSLACLNEPFLFQTALAISGCLSLRSLDRSVLLPSRS